MKKLFGLLMSVFILSCSEPIAHDVITYSYMLCDKNDGLYSLEDEMMGVEVKCNNGSYFDVFKYYNRQKQEWKIKVSK